MNARAFQEYGIAGRNTQSQLTATARDGHRWVHVRPLIEDCRPAEDPTQPKTIRAKIVTQIQIPAVFNIIFTILWGQPRQADL